MAEEKRALSRELSKIKHTKELDKEYEIADRISEKLVCLIETAGEDIRVLETATRVLKTVESIKRDIKGILTVEQAQKLYLERGEYIAELKRQACSDILKAEDERFDTIKVELDGKIRDWAG